MQPAREPASINPLLPGRRVIYNTVETVKQEDGREMRIVNEPCPGVDAGLKQFDQMIDHDIVDKAFPRGRTGTIEQNIVRSSFACFFEAPGT